jgi:superfamily II DNA or RNA helicase
MAGLLACHHLNRRLSSLIVIVVPNRSIRRKTQSEFRHWFDIHLVTFHQRKCGDGIPRQRQGYILTYAHLIQNPDLHHRICEHDTLVIFDEVHHLGDEAGWGEAAKKAFGDVNHIISMSGTPWRGDNAPIPFVEYIKGDGKLLFFRAKDDYGYTYSLGQAIADRECRKPIFVYFKGTGLTVEIRHGIDTGVKVVSFEDTGLSEKESSERLRGAVRYGSVPRKGLLADALAECKAEGRKVIVFLGGDTNNDMVPTEDAREYLPSELQELGYSDADWEIVTGDDAKAQDKIADFGTSSKWILISINMVSEGTDIPELSAAIFLTTVTAKQTMWQRIGRTLRKGGFKDAKLFMFGDPSYFEIANEIVGDVDKITAEDSRLKEKANGTNGTETTTPQRNRTESIGVSYDNVERIIQIDLSKLTQAEYDRLRQRCIDKGLSGNADNIQGMLAMKGFE